jgi:hypothetical protein
LLGVKKGFGNMKSLAERHEDRAKRIVANGSETSGNTAGSTGTAAVHYRTFVESMRGLSEDQRKELEGDLQSIKDEVENGSYSLAEAPDGSGRTMAGIGVINTKVVPAGVDVPEAGNGGGTEAGKVDGWGANASPAAYVKTTEGSNLAGQALEDQGAGSDAKAAAKAATKEAPKTDDKK